MRIRAALAASIVLAAVAGTARAEDVHARFRSTMNSVFGSGGWRITGGYRTPERENELRAQGALTVPAGRLSRHSMGRPGAPGAYDVVVDGMSPWQAAAKLRRAGAPFRTIFAEGTHGTQGPHLHIDPYSGGLKGWAGGPPVVRWTVADPTPAQLSIAILHKAAMQGEPEAQIELGMIYSEGRMAPRNLVEAYVWTAFAAANPAADAETRAEAGRGLETLAGLMKPTEIADAQRFVQAQAQPGASARYVPLIVRRGEGGAIRIAGQGQAQIGVASAAAPAVGTGVQ